MTDVAIKNYEQRIVDHLSNRLESEPCTITKEIFAPLSSVNLFSITRVRQMLRHSGKLANHETFMAKLKKRKIELLVFLEFNSTIKPMQMRFMAVYLDPSEKFEIFDFVNVDTAEQFGERATEDFLLVVGRKASALKQPPTNTAARFPVVITCFKDGTGGASPRQGWNMGFLLQHIPQTLPAKLREKKDYFQDPYPVQFVQFETPGCAPGNLELAKSMNSMFAAKYGEDRWFVWRGMMYLDGFNRFGVKIEFLHYINPIWRAKPVNWHEHPNKIDPDKIPERVASEFWEQWELYLKEIKRERPELPDITKLTPGQ